MKKCNFKNWRDKYFIGVFYQNILINYHIEYNTVSVFVKFYYLLISSKSDFQGLKSRFVGDKKVRQQNACIDISFVHKL